MSRDKVMSSWATWPEAVAEALRLYAVTLDRFPAPVTYAVRKRRTHRYEHAARLWNYGRHDRWLVLTGPNIPDADTANPTRRRA